MRSNFYHSFRRGARFPGGGRLGTAIVSDLL
jgi:hypothetical protein